MTIVRQVKSPAGRWWRIESNGTAFLARPKGTRKGDPSEEAFSSLTAALDRINRDA